MPKIIIEVGKGQSTDQVLAGLKSQLGLVDDQVTLLAENTRRLEREQRQAETAFRKTAASLDPTIAKSQQYAQAQSTLDEALKRNLVTQAEHDRLLAAAQDRYDGTSASLSQLEDRYNATAAALDPAIAKSQEYAQTQQTLDEALKRGLITQEEHDRLLAIAKEKHEEASSSLQGLIDKYLSGATAIAAVTLALSGSLIVFDQVKDFITDSISVAGESERVQAQLGARIASTGGAAELTAAQLADMANELQNASKFDDESLGRAENKLLTFTSVAGETFERALGLISDMSTALGTDLVGNAGLVGKALEDPVKGMQALSRAGVTFTEGEKEVIKKLVESGDLLGAQAKLLDALGTRFGGAAAADVATFGGSLDRLNNLWDNFMERVGDGVLPILESFFTEVGDIIVQNGDLADSLGEVVREGGQWVAVFAAIGAMAADSALTISSKLMGALSDLAGLGARLADAVGFDTMAAKLREASTDMAGNAAIADQLGQAADDVATAALRAAAALGKEGESAAAGAKHSRDHSLADAAAEKEAAKFAKTLLEVRDRLDPVGKAERELAEDTVVLTRALLEGKIGADEYFRLYELGQENVEAAQRKVYEFKVEVLDLIDVLSAADRLQIMFDPGPMPDWDRYNQGSFLTEGFVGPPDPTVMRQYEAEFDEIQTDFTSHLEEGMVSAGETFLMELMQGGDDAWEHLGENLTQVLLQSVAEWLTAQLAAIAKAAIASKAIGGSTGGGGGGGGMGSLASLFGGSGGGSSSGAAGAGSGMLAAAAIVAVVVGIGAYFKHQSDKEHALQYETSSRVNVSDGGVSSESYGRLSESGPAVAEAMASVIRGLEEATGIWIRGTADVEIRIRNDKKGFMLKINDELQGTFQSVSEAIVYAAHKMFSEQALSGVLDERIKAVIDHFSGDDPSKLIENVEAVQKIIDEVGGLTQVEVDLRDLPGRAQALSSELQGMGLTLEQSTELAAQWKARQYQTLRDQITGHQQTAAEEMAEHQRQAAMFNANVTLDKARNASDIAVLEAKLGIVQGEASLGSAEIDMKAAVLASNAELIDDEYEMHEGRLVAIATVNQIQKELLEQQLAALQIAKGYLDSIKLIDPGEIHLGGGHGHGGGHSGNIDTGPSEAEQRATAFNDFIESQLVAGMGDVEAALYNVNKAFDEQMQAAIELGRVEELEAARTAAIARIRQNFLDQAATAGMSDYERAMFELNKAYAEQALLNPELIGGEEELAEARRAAAAQIREDLLDSFGTPLEALQDRIADFLQRIHDLNDANAELAAQYARGEISAEEYAAAIAHSDQVVGDFVLGLKSELLNLALYFTDAMGDTQQSAAIRKQIAQLEWEYKKVELRMMLEAIRAAGGFGTASIVAFGGMFDAIVGGVSRVVDAVGGAVGGILDSMPTPVTGDGSGGPPESDPDDPGTWNYQDWLDWLDSLPDLFPGNIGGGDTGSGSGNSGQDDQLDAMRDLTDALHDLADMQRDLWASDLSPLNAEQQAGFLRDQLEDAYNQANASHDPADIRAFQDLVRDYLESYQDAYGSTGGYTDEFLRINDLINHLLAIGGIGGVVPGPGMPGGPAGTGQGGWRPNGAGVVLPFDRSGGPASPFVVESPALTAIAELTRESNRRLAALEARLSGIEGATVQGNREAAIRAFQARFQGPAGVTGNPTFDQRRMA